MPRADVPGDDVPGDDVEGPPTVIVGAGIAGLSLAAGLRRAGRRVLVLEEREQVAGGAGITLWPNALAALDDLGLGPAVRSAGWPVGTGTVIAPDGRAIRAFPPGALESALGEPVLTIHRHTLMELLRSALPPDAVRWGASVVGVHASAAAAAAAVLADGTRVAASVLVGADGIRSAVARALNPGLTMAYSGFTAWRGVAALTLADGGQAWGGGAEFGWAPLGGGQTYWFAARRAPAGENLGGAGELARLRAEFGGWRGPAAELIAATASTDLARHDLHDRPLARTWRRGRVVLIGDAAHPMRPNLGQGAGQGIEDAAVLSRLLTVRADPAAACAEHVRLRRSRAAMVARQSWLMGAAIGLRPAALGAAAFRLSSALPQRVLLGQIAAVAGARSYRRASS